MHSSGNLLRQNEYPSQTMHNLGVFGELVDQPDAIRNTRRIAKLYLAGAEVDRAALKASLMKAARN